mgnify:CR=1 FL=1
MLLEFLNDIMTPEYDCLWSVTDCCDKSGFHMWRRLDCVIAIELKDLSDLFKMAEFIKAKYSKTLTAKV